MNNERKSPIIGTPTMQMEIIKKQNEISEDISESLKVLIKLHHEEKLRNKFYREQDQEIDRKNRWKSHRQFLIMRRWVIISILAPSLIALFAIIINIALNLILP